MLTGIKLTNWLKHRHLDLALSPMTLICGPNGAGKSSVGDAISYCILADPRRVEAKGDRPQMISEGAEDGRVAVKIGDVEISRDIRTSKLSTTGPIPFPADAATGAAPYLTNSGRFARSDADTKRGVLMQVTRVDMSPAAILQTLQDRGHRAAQMEVLRGIENPSLQLLQKAADQGASEARGAWKALTGETYGAKKAEGWKNENSTLEPPSDAEIGYLQQAVDAADTRIASMNRAAGAAGQRKIDIQQVRARNTKTEQRIKDAAAAQIALAELDLPSKQATAATAQKAMEDAAARRVTRSMCCPTCRDNLLVEGERLVAYSVPENAITEEAFADFVATSRNATRALETASHTAAQLNETIRLGTGIACEPVPEEESDDDAVASLQAARRDLATAQQALQAARSKAASIAAAAQTVTKAAEEHENVKSWIKIQEALAPSGIPSELLVKTLGKINQQLADLSTGARWRTVAIGEDMTVTYGGRAYGLLSESEQWRADIVLTMALAAESKLSFAVVDRLDVLEVEARAPTLGWFYRLTKSGQISSILVLGTLKAPPKVPADVNVYWLGEPIEEKAAA